MILLQLKWTDEEEWKTVEYPLKRFANWRLARARRVQRQIDLRYPSHRFTAEFRIVESAT